MIAQFLREIGYALSALAIWMLLLLSPLHQAANVLVEFQKAGLLSEDAFILCQPSGDSADDQGRAPPTCPFQFAQTVLDVPVGDIAIAAFPTQVVAELLPLTASPPRLKLQTGPRQPTGPPAISQS